MQTLDFFENRSNLNQVVDEAVKALEKGHVLVYPTDTVYGIGCDATRKKPLERIKQIKKIEQNRGFSVIVKDLKMAKKYAQINDDQARVLLKILPGPFTLLFKAQKDKLPAEVIGNQAKIGIRIADYDLTEAIVGKFNKPIVSTSVNDTGEKPETWGVEIIEKYKNQNFKPDLIIDAGKLGGRSIGNDLKFKKNNQEPRASTVIDLSESAYRVVRAGGLDSTQILDLLSGLRS
ncbi:MAG: threonylcarbamoyl-AMP synthase [Candidatus Moranbacteria bacterium]|nr:threonylcarbamoyl-AMP synthase [Candidatus Moranbacteria bacterium]